MTVDSTHIKANASIKSLEPIVVEMKPKEYIEKLERENPVKKEPWEPGNNYPHKGKKISNTTHRSKTDPDARLSRKSATATTNLCHAATYVMDNQSKIIVGADVGSPDLKTDRDNAMEQIRSIKWKYRIKTRRDQ